MRLFFVLCSFCWMNASTLFSQQTLLDTTLEMAHLYAQAPMTFQVLGAGKVTIAPTDRRLGNFSIQLEDGRTWSLRFGQEINLYDEQGYTLASSIESKAMFASRTRLLNRQVTQHGVQFIDDKGQKVLTATRYFEGYYPSTVDIWMKQWEEEPVALELALIALAEVLRQLYAYEG